MNVLKRLVADTDGQGLVEYTLIVFLVAFVFWVAVKNTTIGNALSNDLSLVTDCLNAPFSSCNSGS
jgi:Flp pilus assembly pilin Flp